MLELKEIPDRISTVVLEFCTENISYSGNLSVHGIINISVDNSVLTSFEFTKAQMERAEKMSSIKDEKVECSSRRIANAEKLHVEDVVKAGLMTYRPPVIKEEAAESVPCTQPPTAPLPYNPTTLPAPTPAPSTMGAPLVGVTQPLTGYEFTETMKIPDQNSIPDPPQMRSPVRTQEAPWLRLRFKDYAKMENRHDDVDDFGCPATPSAQMNIRDIVEQIVQNTCGDDEDFGAPSQPPPPPPPLPNLSMPPPRLPLPAPMDDDDDEDDDDEDDDNDPDDVDDDDDDDDVEGEESEEDEEYLEEGEDEGEVIEEGVEVVHPEQPPEPIVETAPITPITPTQSTSSRPRRKAATPRFLGDAFLVDESTNHEHPPNEPHADCELCTERNYKVDATSPRKKGPHRCELCGMEFTWIKALRRHHKIHKGEKIYSCKLCPKKFSWDISLKQHMRIHTGENLYECKTCGKKLAHLSSLKHHEKLHTGEKPHKCEVCGKAFIQLTNLKKHLRSHTGEKPCKCEYCGKCFGHAGNLNHHIRLHTGTKPYQCDQCGRQFTQVGHLQSHMRTHTGERPYGCEQCGMSFVTSSAKKRHQRIHNNEYPFVCEQCGRQFRRKDKMTEHIRVRHSDRAPAPHKKPDYRVPGLVSQSAQPQPQPGQSTNQQTVVKEPKVEKDDLMQHSEEHIQSCMMPGLGPTPNLITPGLIPPGVM